MCNKILNFEQIKFCSKSCSAKNSNSVRDPKSREQQKITLCKTLKIKFPPKAKNNKKEIYPYTPIQWSPITGNPYNKFYSKNEWDRPVKMKTVKMLQYIGNFQLQQPDTEIKIKETIEKLKFHYEDECMTPTQIKKMYNINYTDFGTFLFNLGIKRRNYSNGVKAYYNSLNVDLNLWVNYHRECQFKLKKTDLLKIEGIHLLNQIGMYHPTKNPKGCCRDHMFSIKEGFDQQIDPSIIKHPANCKIILGSDNFKKGSKCSISINELIERIQFWI